MGLAGAAWEKWLEEVPNYVKDLGNSIGQSVEDYIASGEPESLTGKIVQSGYRSACRRWARGEGPDNAEWQNNQREICGKYLKEIGEWPGDAGPGDPSFTGGQCAISYEVTVATDGDFPSGPTLTATITNVLGPIQGAVIARSGDAEGSGCSFADTPSTQVVFSQGRRITVQCWPDNGPPNGDFNPRNPRVVGVRPLGAPDICGDPFPPPVNPTDPALPPIVPGPPPGTPPSIDIDLPVTINPDGTIEICADGNCVTFNPDPSPSDPALEPGNQGEPGQGGDSGVGGVAEGEAPKGKILVGVRVNLLAIPEAAREYAPGVYRGAMFLYMGGPGGLDQDFGGSMVSDGQFFYAEPENATAWRVRANFGYNLRVTPFYREAS